MFSLSLVLKYHRFNSTERQRQQQRQLHPLDFIMIVVAIVVTDDVTSSECDRRQKKNRKTVG